MYILNRTLYNHAQERIQKANQELYRIQETLSCGKQIVRPSYNPEGAEQVLHYRSVLSNIQQYSDNIDFGYRWCQATNDTLKTASDLLLRCRQVAQSQADSTATQQTRAVSAKEIEEIYHDLVDLANIKHEGRYLFAPEQLLTPPFNPQTAAEDEPAETERPPEFLMRIKIGDEKQIQVNTSKEVFTGGQKGKNIFRVVSELKTSLENNDPEAIRAAFAEIDQAMEQIKQQQGEIGVRMQRLERTQEAFTELKGLTESALSQREDADLIEKAVDFVTKSNHQSINLATLAKILNTNLLDLLG
ncbi:MAG: hypothetical protein K6U11_07090 [bacterium]|nr:hypothetical protein [bacterium]